MLVSDKIVYLTFDDGPIPEVTPWVLNVLQEHGAKATFFCVGKNARKYPELCRQILDSGHAIGNHTESHLNGWKTNRDDYCNDVIKCTEVVNSKLFRPPF